MMAQGIGDYVGYDDGDDDDDDDDDDVDCSLLTTHCVWLW